MLPLERSAKPSAIPEPAEFVSKDLDIWVYKNDVALDFSRLGKPTANSSSNPSMASSEANA